MRKIIDILFWVFFGLLLGKLFIPAAYASQRAELNTVWYNKYTTNQGDKMFVLNKAIKHDGGTHNVEVEVEGDQLVIRFGHSFTLRVDEVNADKLREILYDGCRELTITRRDTSDVRAPVADREINSSIEDEMIERGIDAREKLKASRRSKCTDNSGAWDPNNPVNW